MKITGRGTSRLIILCIILGDNSHALFLNCSILIFTYEKMETRFSFLIISRCCSTIPCDYCNVMTKMGPHLPDFCKEGSFGKIETIGEIKQEMTDLTVILNFYKN